MELLIWTFIRLTVPLLILRWPLLGIIASSYADGSDFNNLVFKSRDDYEYYQVWDKILDVYYYSFAAYVSLSWKDKIARAISIFSFSYRLIGVFLFMLLGFRSILFIFPNFFENFFIFYLLFVKFGRTEILFRSKRVMAIVGLSILVPKLAQEYFMHILQIPPNSLLGFGIENKDVLSWIDGFLYLAIPGAILAFLIKRARK